MTVHGLFCCCYVNNWRHKTLRTRRCKITGLHSSALELSNEFRLQVLESKTKKPFPVSPFPVAIFPPSVLMTEAEASLAEPAPLCLTKHSPSDTQTYAELPSSTMLGRAQSPAAVAEQKSEVRKRAQGSPTYIRSKIKVSERDGAVPRWSPSGPNGEPFTLKISWIVNKHRLHLCVFPPQVTTGELPSLCLPPVSTPPPVSPPVPPTPPAPMSPPEPQAVAPMVTRTGQRQSSASGTTGTFVCQVCH